jgi:hypothetical protein
VLDLPTLIRLVRTRAGVAMRRSGGPGTRLTRRMARPAPARAISGTMSIPGPRRWSEGIWSRRRRPGGERPAVKGRPLTARPRDVYVLVWKVFELITIWCGIYRTGTCPQASILCVPKTSST